MVKLKDYLFCTPIHVKIFVKYQDSRALIQNRLPDGYTLDEQGAEGMTFSFPAGYEESYFVVNGKIYDCKEDGTSREEQENFIKKDLMAEGLMGADLDEYIASIGIKKGVTKFLDIGESNKYLKDHPEFEAEAKIILEKSIKEAISEIENKQEVRKGLR